MKKTPARFAAIFAPTRGTGLIAASLTVAVPLLLTGCGSGSGHSPVFNSGAAASVSRARGSATFSIKWPAPTRLIPAAAQSVVLTLTRVNPGPAVAPVAPVVLPRPAAGQPLTVSTTINNLELGDYIVTATANPNADGSGNPQASGPQPGGLGSATVPVTIKAGTNSPLNITMFGTVNTIFFSPTPFPTIKVNQTRTLTATALDSVGNAVLTGKSILFTSSDPTVATIDANGVIKGLKVGTVTIAATYSEAASGTPLGAQGTGASASITITIDAIGNVVPNPLATSVWPKFHGDAQNTGQVGPLATGNATTGTVISSYTLGNAVYLTSPAIGPNGDVYVGSWDGNVYALKRSGNTFTVAWKFQTGGIIESSPALAADGTLYVGSYDGVVYALPTNPPDPLNVVPTWTFSTPGVVHGSPAIGLDGTVYVGSSLDQTGASNRSDNKLYALDGKTGTQLWTFQAGGGIQTAPALSANGDTVYVGSLDGNLYAIPTLNTGAATHSALWATPTGGDLYSSSPVLAKIGGAPYLFIGSTSQRAFAISAVTGNILWSKSIGTVFATPAVATDASGNATAVYFATYDTSPTRANYLYKLNPADGNPVWQFPTVPNVIGAVVSSPAIGQNGTVYFGSEDGNVYAAKPDGTPQWGGTAAAPTGITIGGGGGFIDSSPAIGTDGSLYIGATVGGNSGLVISIQ